MKLKMIVAVLICVAAFVALAAVYGGNSEPKGEVQKQENLVSEESKCECGGIGEGKCDDKCNCGGSCKGDCDDSCKCKGKCDEECECNGKCNDKCNCGGSCRGNCIDGCTGKCRGSCQGHKVKRGG